MFARYVHELPEWPKFSWDESRVNQSLFQVEQNFGRVLALLEFLGFPVRKENTLKYLSREVLQTNEIEGELFEPDQVRSSLAKKLGLETAGLPRPNRKVDGFVEVLWDATRNYLRPLDEKRLLKWHTLMFPDGKSGSYSIETGTYRSGPMAVVSGAMGKEKIHFEAPEADRLPEEMSAFFRWMESENDLHPAVKAGVAHFWFVTLHPFDDGNGRLARVITELLLCRHDKEDKRFYSLSAQIMRKRKQYYAVLEKSQKGNLDLSEWMLWFLECLNEALRETESSLKMVLKKAKFWEYHNATSLNDRQRKVINRMFEGFEGNLTSSKYAKLTKASPDTALRDMADLVEKGILLKSDSGGRSTHYVLVNS